MEAVMAVGSSFPSHAAAAAAPQSAAVPSAPANPEFLTTDEAGAFLRSLVLPGWGQARLGRNVTGGLFVAFILGGILALVIGQSKTAENFIAPVLTFFQGIPALSWVVFAIIWFHGIEFRVLFIMVMTTLPAFTFQILDAFRSMSKDLYEMTMSFRPRRWTLFRFLIVPTIVPGILTAWKVNLGNAARVVVVAELVGATGGVGYQLLRQQQLFWSQKSWAVW